jgi:hypothetical protein
LTVTFVNRALSTYFSVFDGSDTPSNVEFATANPCTWAFESPLTSKVLPAIFVLA